MFADRLHQEDPLKLSAGRQGILLDLGKCLITGDKLQAAQGVVSSKDPLALALGHPQDLHHHRHHPFLHPLIIYHPTNRTLFLNSLPYKQYLTTLVLEQSQSGAMSHLFSLLLVEDMAVGYMVVEDMAVEGMVLDRGILAECMEIWPQCSQVLPLILVTIATVTTSLMAMGPVLWSLHVLPNHHLQMV